MYCVILAGGSGTRFWPVSRIARPKQLISITDGPTMLQRTIERILPLKPQRILVVTNRLQAEETGRQLAGYRDMVPVDIIAEPIGRNTAPAVGLAASIIAAHDPDGVMLVLPADHYIRDDAGLRKILQVAVINAAKGRIITLGIFPTCPETGYGYLEADMGKEDCGAFPVVRFVEKPDHQTALEYLDAGTFFWNSGMFVWRADVILTEIAKYMPELSEQLRCLTCGDDWSLSDLNTRIAEIYDAVRSQSIDYGVMEKSDQVYMIPTSIGWSDVGSWSALSEVVDVDEQGSVASGCEAHIAIDSNGCVVSGNGGVVATIGVNDLIVVATDDAVLVCPRDRAQEVRNVVEQLTLKGLHRYL